MTKDEALAALKGDLNKDSEPGEWLKVDQNLINQYVALSGETGWIHTDQKLARERTKMRSSLYGVVDEFAGLGKLDLLASFALFDSDPARFNRLEAEFAKVTPEQLRKTAQEYLRKENRTVYTVKPGAKDAPTASAQEN